MFPAVLGIDTSGSWCSAALVRGDVRHARRAEVGSAHAEHLLTMVDAVLADAALDLSACDVVAFSAGPGSFTGLRVGCAVAQGLAFGAGRPVAAIGTLEAIAHSVTTTLDDPPAVVLVAQDARMGEVYWALVARNGPYPTTLAGPALATPRQLHDRVREASHAAGVSDSIDLGCGNAWSVHGAALDGLVSRVVERASADATDVALLGAHAWATGRMTDAAGAAPVYVRDRVASTTVERALEKATRNAGGRTAPLEEAAPT